MICQIPFHVGMVLAGGRVRESREEKQPDLGIFNIINTVLLWFCIQVQSQAKFYFVLNLKWFASKTFSASQACQGPEPRPGDTRKVGAGPCSQGRSVTHRPEVCGCHQTETFPKTSVFRTESCNYSWLLFYMDVVHFFNCSSELLYLNEQIEWEQLFCNLGRAAEWLTFK